MKKASGKVSMIIIVLLVISIAAAMFFIKPGSVFLQNNYIYRGSPVSYQVSTCAGDGHNIWFTFDIGSGIDYNDLECVFTGTFDDRDGNYISTTAKSDYTCTSFSADYASETKSMTAGVQPTSYGGSKFVTTIGDYKCGVYAGSVVSPDVGNCGCFAGKVTIQEKPVVQPEPDPEPTPDPFEFGDIETGNLNFFQRLWRSIIGFFNSIFK